MCPPRRQRSAFTLMEVLMVVVVIGILAALAMPGAPPAARGQLQTAAHVVAAELAYARSLAVANNSKYRFTIDAARNQIVLEHSGANAGLKNLPESPFRSPNDPPSQHIVNFNEMPHMGTAVRLAGATSSGNSLQAVDTVEFGPLGATTRGSPTSLWLSVGSGDDCRYMSVEVNPVTGLATVGPFGKEGPAVSGM